MATPKMNERGIRIAIDVCILGGAVMEGNES